MRQIIWVFKSPQVQPTVMPNKIAAHFDRIGGRKACLIITA